MNLSNACWDVYVGSGLHFTDVAYTFIVLWTLTHPCISRINQFIVVGDLFIVLWNLSYSCAVEDFCIQAHRASSTVICLLHAVSIGYWSDMNLINWVCKYSLFNFQRHLKGSAYSFKCLAGFSREAIRCRDRFSLTRTLVTSSMSLFIFLHSCFLFSHGLVLLGYVDVETHPFLSDNLICWHIIALTLLRFFILFVVSGVMSPHSILIF